MCSLEDGGQALEGVLLSLSPAEVVQVAPLSPLASNILKVGPDAAPKFERLHILSAFYNDTGRRGDAVRLMQGSCPSRCGLHYERSRAYILDSMQNHLDSRCEPASLNGL